MLSALRISSILDIACDAYFFANFSMYSFK